LPWSTFQSTLNIPSLYLHLNLPSDSSFMCHISKLTSPNQLSLSMIPPLRQKGLLISRPARPPNE
jgi:hypothetical protein